MSIQDAETSDSTEYYARAAMIDRAVASKDRSQSHPAVLRTLQRDSNVVPERLDLWASSPEREWYLARAGRLKCVWLFAFSALILIAVVVVASVVHGRARSGVVNGLLVLAGVLFLLASQPYVAGRFAFWQRRRALVVYNNEIALEQLCEQPADGSESTLPLNRMFQYNRRQLDLYQLITRRQQVAAFVLTWGAAVLGFGLLVAAVVISLHHFPAKAKYVTGGVSGVGALLSGYLSKTFFAGQREASKQMRSYYAEPFLNGRMLAAERVAVTLGDNAKLGPYVTDIVSTLTAWGEGPKSGNAQPEPAKKTAAKKTAAKKTAAGRRRTPGRTG